MELSFIQENVKMSFYKDRPNKISKQGNSFTKQVDSIWLKACSWTTVAPNDTSQGNLCIQKAYLHIHTKKFCLYIVIILQPVHLKALTHRLRQEIQGKLFLKMCLDVLTFNFDYSSCSKNRSLISHILLVLLHVKVPLLLQSLLRVL